ncbi:MAG: hypoxanthine phosphoribosyltransferase [Culturomica sp.]|jgi:hypoxanthine phosphoribosyltransferase|nr:hypoxanthine phosphoribosyltransferase [Culturomica sp.]
MKTVRLHDREFRLLINEKRIDEAVIEMATRMNAELAGKSPVFLGILNGSFMFAADLMKQITVENTEIHFVKISSYEGTQSSGKINELIGLKSDIKGRTVVILEDVIETGRSIEFIQNYLRQQEPTEVLTATLFFKPQLLQCNIHVDYYGIKLGDEFIVGRGLDYNGLGRNFPDLYILNE